MHQCLPHIVERRLRVCGLVLCVLRAPALDVDSVPRELVKGAREAESFGGRVREEAEVLRVLAQAGERGDGMAEGQEDARQEGAGGVIDAVCGLEGAEEEDEGKEAESGEGFGAEEFVEAEVGRH
jgi:hypothetical protein